ncbi:DUF523 domain-containing protein [Pantoea sp. Acro-805]|uniref:DUF523 domain-containing protein n=1 Tax=Candidatus Pantoea formicae TaxID=2608355 RepID=A0ABX0QS74_9GAMM|nr:DUF523 domain-containing protein [Pantoea formicae]MDF7650320.1 DUF523 domain-containing protein [Erwiniaceae bacterium L1_54_3]NIE99912.1 DUF523 domain-containing protein [Pantoea formicae]
MEKILVSACLMGFAVRYNGSDKLLISRTLARWREEQRLVIHCPELAAGLHTPRLPAEIHGGSAEQVLAGNAQILESDGRDVTQHYVLAAWLALRAAQAGECRFALLTDGSPTCGSQKIYDGSFSGQQTFGNGVAAALLRQHGIDVFAEAQLPELIQRVDAADKCRVVDAG